MIRLASLLCSRPLFRNGSASCRHWTMIALLKRGMRRETRVEKKAMALGVVSGKLLVCSLSIFHNRNSRRLMEAVRLNSVAVFAIPHFAYMWSEKLYRRKSQTLPHPAHTHTQYSFFYRIQGGKTIGEEEKRFFFWQKLKDLNKRMEKQCWCLCVKSISNNDPSTCFVLVSNEKKKKKLVLILPTIAAPSARIMKHCFGVDDGVARYQRHCRSNIPLIIYYST